MKTVRTLLLSSLLSTLVWAAPATVTEGATSKDFLEPGWEIQMEASGDLNGDKYPDLVVVTRGTDPARVREADPMVGTLQLDPETGEVRSLLNGNPRTLLVLLGRKEGGYRLVGSNAKIIPAPVSPNGETLDSVAISGGKVRVELTFMDRKHGERYAKIGYSFTYAADKVVFSGAHKSEFRRSANEEESRYYDFSTRKVSVEKWTYPAHESVSKTTRSLPKQETVTLDEITREWPVEPDYKL